VRAIGGAVAIGRKRHDELGIADRLRGFRAHVVVGLDAGDEVAARGVSTMARASIRPAARRLPQEVRADGVRAIGQDADGRARERASSCADERSAAKSGCCCA
jgi:hypothetical protein